MSRFISDLLGLSPLDNELHSFIRHLSSQLNPPHVDQVPDVKSYPDAVYFNYYSLGISIMFLPKSPYKPSVGLKLKDLQFDSLTADSIYIYNHPKIKRPTSTESSFSTYPVSPISFQLSKVPDNSRPQTLDVLQHTSGKDFVAHLGEPDRKGGGAGPSSGSIDIWCEWSKDGIMVEFGGDEARGPQAWEHGKDAVWKIITVFQPKTS